MSERRPFDKEQARAAPRRFEWVSLSAGDICVRELTVRETMTLTERSARPPIDPRGGVDPGESVFWQIVLSCYTGEEEGAKQLFSESDREDVRTIYALRVEDFTKLMAAINRVNGQDATEAELLRDFTQARQGVPSLP